MFAFPALSLSDFEPIQAILVYEREFQSQHEKVHAMKSELNTVNLKTKIKPAN